MTLKTLGAAYCLALAGILCAPAAQAQAQAQAQAANPTQLLPAIDFFKHAAMSRAVLSPSGRRIAVHVPDDHGRVALAVVDLEPPMKGRMVAHYTDADVRDVHWVNDNRLVFDTLDLTSGLADQRFGPGLFAVNADGSNYRQLVRPQFGEVSVTGTRIKGDELAYNHTLEATVADGSADVILARWDWPRPNDRAEISLVRVNTETGSSRPISRGAPVGAVQWLTDKNGVPRIVYTMNEGKGRLYWRATPDGEWTLLNEDANVMLGTRLRPLALDESGNLYVTATGRNAKRTQELYRYHLADRKLDDKPLISLKGFDFAGNLVFDRTNTQLLGIQFETDAPGAVWLDARLKGIQDEVDKLLPSTANTLLASCRECDKAQQVLVRAESDRVSPMYLLYDVEKKSLQRVGASRPWLDGKPMATRRFETIQARDGLELPVWITEPSGKGPWPTVVLVHGGPWLRGGHWEWDADSQFLASRGYAVVEPEFRGSTGFGDKLYRAGFKQWGLAMQDDVADATRWAISKNIAAKDRICIAGASYGGYATLMGLLKDPDLYRCGVDWVGVTDIDLMYSIAWSDLDNTFEQYGMPTMVGDREKDRAQLDATSPLKQAERIRQPVLMAYGGGDRRVPIEHGKKFRDAVKKVNNQVEWVEYPEEGHGFLRVQNNVDFWTRVEKFLARNIGGTSTAGTTEASASK